MNQRKNRHLHQEKSLMQKMWLTAVVVVIYLAAFFLISSWSQIEAEILAILPIFMIGLLWGLRTGALAGLLGIPLNMFLIYAVGRSDWNVFTHQHHLAGAVGSIIIGVAAGYINSIGEQSRRELAEHRRIDNNLQLLNAAVESLPLGITIVDTESKILYLNPAEAGMHDRRVEELLGMDSRILAPRESWKPMPFEQLHAMGIWRRESVNIRANGDLFPVQLTSIAVKNDEGTPIGIITACEDITERRRAEEALHEGEASYRTLSENLPGIVYRVHLRDNNRMQIFNEMLAPMTGYTAEELMSGEVCSIEPLIVPEDRKGVVRKAKQAVVTAEPFEAEYRLRHKNGEIRYFLERGRPLRGPDGLPSHIDGVILDITERKRAEKKLVQREEALRSVYRMATTLGSSFKSICGEIVSNLARLLGVSHVLILIRELGKVKVVSGIGKGDFIGGEKTDCPESCPCNDVYRVRKTVLHTGPLRDICPGHPFAASNLSNVASVPVIGAGGDVFGAINVIGWQEGHFSDDAIRLTEIFARHLAFVIEREKMEDRLRKSEKLEVIGKLAGGVAHEVRNPLNAIMALSDALAMDVGHNSELEPYLVHIRAQVDRLSVLMRDLLELGKPVEQAQMQRVSLVEACSTAVDIWNHFGRRRTHAVEIVSPPGAGVRVTADARKLHQVFVNLLDNAAQHSPEDTAIQLIIHAPVGEMCRIAIVDRGAGIPQDMLARVFEPFFSTRRGGTGLGMSIVKHIVEAHGGTVTIANNAPPPGCTVEIGLPLVEREKS
jgi:PAS domain S-box-containing protein